jgi:hypothetical protein
MIMMPTSPYEAGQTGDLTTSMLVEYRFPPGIWNLCNRGFPISTIVVKSPKAITLRT